MFSVTWKMLDGRVSDDVDFNRGWEDYAAGFGNLSGNFWMGLRKMHQMTLNDDMELQIELETFDGNIYTVNCGEFSVGSEDDDFVLEVSDYSGEGEYNDLAYQDEMKFSTNDRDNDLLQTYHCATFYSGGWWYRKCHSCNLNGIYSDHLPSQDSGGIHWRSITSFNKSLKRAEMKTRRRPG